MDNETQATKTTSASKELPSSTGLIPAMPVKAESMEHGKLYIWNKGDGRMSVTTLSVNGECLMELDPPDEWYFEDELIGSLHGPIFLSSNIQGEARR